MAEVLGWRSKEARIQGKTDRNGNHISISISLCPSEMDGQDGRANRRLKICISDTKRGERKQESLNMCLYFDNLLVLLFNFC
jgi:hypothetical protein